MEKLWTFYEYGKDGTRAIFDHLQTVSERVDADFWERIRYMEQMTANEWSPSWAKQLVNNQGLFELRFKSDGVQQRPIACYGRSPGSIVLLTWATEKGDRFKPKSALATAAARKREIYEGEVQPRLLSPEPDSEEEAS